MVCAGTRGVVFVAGVFYRRGDCGVCQPGIGGKAVESFSEAVRLAATEFHKDPTDLPRIPAWNRVMSALPDFLDRLSAVVTEENRMADQALAAQKRKMIGIENRDSAVNDSIKSSDMLYK
ncbi:MAG: hypothetical protein GY869_27060 [Planctomycetes bacterium]|nr:hypothetical protein [Planctomycetota bacterium]